MYKQSTPLRYKFSASLLYNNFDVFIAEDQSETLLSTIHKSSVVIFNPALVQDPEMDNDKLYKRILCKGESPHNSSMIMQAKWCVLPQRTVLVIASVKGVQMFEADGSVMVFWQALNQNTNGTPVQYARGIAAVGEKYVCVGTANGGILVYDIPVKGVGLKFQETLLMHDCSISDLHSKGDIMVSGDDRGKVIVWKSGGNFEKVCFIEGFDYPATSLRLWKAFVIVGYGSGHIRVFSSDIGNIAVEIAAHAKWINAIDVVGDLLLTTSEDTYVRVFNLNNYNLLFQVSVGDWQITGGRFLDKNGDSFGVTSYDSNEVQVFHKK